MEPLKSIAALRDEIGRMPPVPAGKVRVFRGQTSDYATIKAAAVRNRLARQVIWNVYFQALLANVSGNLGEAKMDDAMLQVSALWLHAVAQHYGAGSRFLDVTLSVESAAWFALHRSECVKERAWLGPPGPPSPYDLLGETEWIEYSRTADPGFLYAFDVAVWDGSELPIPDLALVDLHTAPEPFRAPRMLAQQGCLIHVGEADGYDLKKHCVPGTPLLIAWPMLDSDMVNSGVEDMFPPPSVDSWYRRFLSVPLNPETDPNTGTVVLRRPLAVTLYKGMSNAYNNEIAATESFLSPPLVHRAVQEQHSGEEDSTSGEWWEGFSIHGATPIVLEAPFFFPLPTPGPRWNHELLLNGIAETAPWYAAEGDQYRANGEVGLDNVLVQFSPMEHVFWDRANTSEVETTLPRGVWLARRGDELMAVLLLQPFPGATVSSLTPALIRLDSATRRLVVKPAYTDRDWSDLSDLWLLAKPVFVALHVLREISPLLKPEAYPRGGMRVTRADGSVENHYTVALTAGAAILTRCPDPAGVADWYSLRDQDGDPYTHSRIGAGVIELVTDEQFADVRAEAFREAWLAQLAAKKP